MNTKRFTLRSLKTGGLYLLEASEIQEFYDEHVLGAAVRFGATARDRCTSRVKPDKLEAGDGFLCFGTVLLKLFDAGGGLKAVQAAVNLVVNTGKDAVIDRLQAATPAVHDFQAIGTGTTAPAAGNTALETEIGTRVQGTLSQPTSTTDRLVSTFAAGNGTGAITETGRLNASTAGNLFARQTFSVVNKAAGDSLQVTHDITVS